MFLKSYITAVKCQVQHKMGNAAKVFCAVVHFQTARGSMGHAANI